jgi:hypothetical protein
LSRVTADPSESHEQPTPAERRPARRPSPGQTLGAMWLYSLLRFGLFFALWGLLWLANVPSLLAAVIALVLSIPLSYILLRRQRDRLAANLEARVNARQAERQHLDDELSGGPYHDDYDPVTDDDTDGSSNSGGSGGTGWQRGEPR